MKHNLDIQIPMAFVDLETTGTNQDTDSITEVGLVLLDVDGTMRHWSSLVKPKQLISPFVEQLTGITNEMVSGAPSFSELAQEITQLIEGRLFVAHNVGFDYPILNKHLQESGYDFKSPRLCTVKSCRRVIQGLPSYSLGRLCTTLGVTLNNAHRALADAEACYGVFCKMVESVGLESVLKHAVNLWLPQSLPPGLSFQEATELPDQPGVIQAYHQGQLKWVKGAQSLSVEIFQCTQAKGPKYLIKEFPLFDQFEFIPTGSYELAKLIENDCFVALKPTLNRNRPQKAKAQMRSVSDQILFTQGRHQGESGFLMVESGAIIGYGFFYREDMPSSWDSFKDSLQSFSGELSFRTELEKWVQYRKFRNLPREKMP